MPFVEAAEMGTHKVITEHSTIGMLVTTDGSIGEIPRESYVEAEERIVREMKAIGKPFALVLNSARPESAAARNLAYELEDAYGVPVALVSCLTLDAEDIRHILRLVLEEFPICEITLRMPEWTRALDEGHRVRIAIEESLGRAAERVTRVGDVRDAFLSMVENDYIARVRPEEIDLGTGRGCFAVDLRDGLYYEVISELTGFSVSGERELVSLLQELAAVKVKYDKVADALESVERGGYGIVMPDVEELHLEEPKIVKQSGGYGVRLCAAAQSIHMIRANIETEINPVVGTEQQSEDLVRYMLREFEEDPKRIWSTNLFGKSLYELVNEGLHTKLAHMPEESRQKLSQTLERIINEGSNGLICILL